MTRGVIGIIGLEATVIIIATIALALIAFILYTINKRLSKKIILGEKIMQKQRDLKQEFQEIENSNSELQNKLKIIDHFTREFFEKEFKIARNLDYSEIADIFEENKRKDLVVFCRKMLDLLYSGSHISKSDVDSAINSMKQILIKQYPRIEKIEIKQLEKKPVEQKQVEKKQVEQKPVEKKQVEQKLEEEILKKQAGSGISLRNIFKFKKEGNIAAPTMNVPTTKEIDVKLYNAQPSEKNFLLAKKKMIREAYKSQNIEVIKEQPPEKNIPSIKERNTEIFNAQLSEKSVAKSLALIDEEQIQDAYKELQKRFGIVYERAKKTSNARFIKQLEEFRGAIISKIEEYLNHHNAEELSIAIIKGNKLISSLEQTR